MSVAHRSVVADARRLVVKVGTSLVTNEGRGIDHAAVARWADEIASLKRDGSRRPSEPPRSARWGSCRPTR